MSNDRLYLRCRHCGAGKCMAKFFPSQAFTVWGDKPDRAAFLSDWICHHMEHNPRFHSGDLGLDSGFDVLTENQFYGEADSPEDACERLSA